VLFDPLCGERLPITGAASWWHTWGGPDLIAWQPLPANAPMAFSSGGDYCVPVVTPTPGPTPPQEPAVCSGTVAATLRLGLRSAPWGLWVSGLEPGDVVDIVGQYQGSDFPDDTWYYVNYGAISGYAKALWIESTGCPSEIPQRPPAPRIYDPNVICQLVVPQNVSLYSIKLTRDTYDIFETEPAALELDSSRIVTVYGRSNEPLANYRYLITEPAPGTNPRDWRWISSSTARLDALNPILSNCDYNKLAAFNVPSGTDSASASYVSILDFYRNYFGSPVNAADRPNAVNSTLYQGRGHNGIDVTVHPGPGTEAVPFTVVAPYDGVIMDAGPDGIAGTNKVEATFGSMDLIQPRWVYECIMAGGYGAGCPAGTWASASLNESGVRVLVMYARSVLDVYGRNPHYIRHDGWDGRGFGLTNLGPVSVASLITGGYQWLCGSELTQCNEPGRQVVIAYDINGLDTGCQNSTDSCYPEIQAVFLHTQYQNPAWNGICSGNLNGAQLSTFRGSMQNEECRVTSGAIIGTAQDIGFSSAPHLHYSVYIDLNQTGTFPPEDSLDESIDPLIARSMTR
jgi:hypothetical protein